MMRRFTASMLICSLFLVSCDKNEEIGSTPHYEGLGNYEMAIQTQSPEAQKYFNQGLIFLFGYNYPEATRAFRAAAACDPSSGICHWGEAVSLAECIDTPGDKWCVQAFDAMVKANDLMADASGREKELIHTIVDRYQKESGKYKIFDMHFVDKMKQLHEKYPDDPDIAAIFANSYMYEIDMAANMVNGEPTGATKEIVDALEEGMEKHPSHPGLNHFYIHAMENCGTPHKALGAAERLDGAVPLSGHLQHMPAHIYYIYGRYHDASAANQRGIDADAALFASGGVQDPDFAGFYLHNHYYLFRSLTMEGRSQDALDAAEKVLGRIKSGELPSDPYIDNVYQSVPYLLLARFGKWDAIDEKEPPPANLTFTRGIWHYVSGLSALQRKSTKLGEQHLVHLKQIKEEYDQKPNDAAYSESLSNILEMASLDLEGQNAAILGKPQVQIENLNKAFAIEQSMYLGMLPWYMPMRHALGDAYLGAGMPAEAERVYLDDLKKNPKNGWALQGLIQSLKAQKKYNKLFNHNSEMQEAWKYADISPVSSRF